MRQMPVVLIELERDHAGDFGQRVEFVQEEPLMLQHSPPGLDHGI